MCFLLYDKIFTSKCFWKICSLSSEFFVDTYFISALESCHCIFFHCGWFMTEVGCNNLLCFLVYNVWLFLWLSSKFYPCLLFFFNSLNLTCLGIRFVMLDVLWVLCSMVWWLSLILKNNFDHYFFKLFFLLCSGFYSGISITYIFECLTLFHSLEFLFMSFLVIFLIIQFG